MEANVKEWLESHKANGDADALLIAVETLFLVDAISSKEHTEWSLIGHEMASEAFKKLVPQYIVDEVAA